MSPLVALLGVALLVALDASVWLIAYRRSTETGLFREIDANLTTAMVNVSIALFGAIASLVKVVVR